MFVASFGAFNLSAAKLGIAVLLIALALAWPNDCRANETGWLATLKSAVVGKNSCYFNAKGIKSIYHNQGYVLVVAAPEWNIVAYNDRSKLFFKSTPAAYVKEQLSTYMSSGIHDIDMKLWSKPEPCSLNGKAAIKYTYLAKKADAEVKGAECWFSRDISIPLAFAKCMGEINRVPAEPHLLLRYVRHRKGDTIGDVMVETETCTKTTIPPGCFSYPKNYRLADNFLHVEVGNLGRDLIDEMSR